MAGVIGVFNLPGGEEIVNNMADILSFRGSNSKVNSGENYSIGELTNSFYSGEENIPVAMEGFCREKRTRKILNKKQLWEKYKTEGPDLLNEIEGEFVIAVWNGSDDYMLARDPLGVKSLYYFQTGGELFFAPEVKALIEIGTGVEEFPAGSFYHPKYGWKTYFNLSPQKVSKKDLCEEIKILRTTLSRNVGEMLPSKEPWGLFLSGGLDSSIIVLLASQICEQEVEAFTVGVEGSADVDYAKLVAGETGITHDILTYDGQKMMEVLPKVIFHLESFDAAFVRSSVPNYLAAQLAGEKEKKIMLTGEGSDEIFAGYDYLKEMSEDKINRETERLIGKMHGTGLERVNRMNAAFGLECRLPFLGLDFVQRAVDYPSDWKIKGARKRIDKWILRKAFSSELGEVAWREKQQFDQGTGSSNILQKIIEERISDEEFEKGKKEVRTEIRSKEEFYYYQIFRRYFPEEITSIVGRWVLPY